MSPASLLSTNLMLIIGCMTALWVLSTVIKNASIVDIFWGPGFAIVAIATFSLIAPATELQQLITVLTCAWGIRLGIYLAFRNIGHGEDPRYVAMRSRAASNGKNFTLFSLVSVFMLQGVIMWIVSLPVQVGQLPADAATIGPLAVAGSILWLAGFLFEAVGDYQLTQFKKNPENRGNVMASGLWRYTRHPNYFGNACIWWGIFLVACENPAAWWTIISPLLMTFFLMKVSGVSLLEKSLVASKPKYAEYQRKTSAFFPRPPKA